MKHLTPAVTSDWLYRLPERFRSDSIPDRALSAASGPSPASGAGSDRPSSSLAEADGGTFHRDRISSGLVHDLSSTGPGENLSRRLRLDPPRSHTPEPTGILSLVPAVRGELGGSSEFERSPNEGAGNPFGEVRSFSSQRGTAR